MDMKYAIAVDIGGTNIRAALIAFNIDSGYAIKARVKKETGDDPIAVLDSLIEQIYAKHSGDLCGIAIAVAGIVDRTGDGVLRSPNISKIEKINIRAEIRKRYRTCVIVANDANAAAYGERCAGAGRDYKNFVLLTLGTGIGGGIVVGGKLLPVAAEIGHMSINASGEPCACGNVGCLESYASAKAIIGSAVSEIEKGTASILKDHYSGNFYKLTAEDIYKAALDGDSLARAVLKTAGKNLGIGIANIVNIFSPEAVILTGGLIGAWNIYVEAAVQEASRRALKELFAEVNIIPSSLGDDAGIIGAAALVFKKSRG
jgi:glucokinase